MELNQEEINMAKFSLVKKLIKSMGGFAEKTPKFQQSIAHMPKEASKVAKKAPENKRG